MVADGEDEAVVADHDAVADAFGAEDLRGGASARISARSCATASSVRSKRQSSGRGRISTENCQSFPPW